MELPCKQCILMAICNAKMHTPEKKNGMNAYMLALECKILKEYLEKYHSRVVDSTTINISLFPVNYFFMHNYDYIYYLSDNLRDNGTLIKKYKNSDMPIAHVYNGEIWERS